jgi:hypothetical protein
MRHESEGFQPFKRELPSSGGNLFRRALAARAIASLRRCAVAQVVAEKWPSDRALLQMVTRASVAPATTFTTGWAAELATTRVANTIEALGVVSAAADVMQAGLVLDWDGAATITAPGFVTSANNASFVAEGAPIPVRQLSAPPASMTPTKLASLAVLTREMMESSNAEALIADALVGACGLALDAVFFGTAAAIANTQPAGIRSGIAALTASNSTDLAEAFAADLATLINAVGAVGGKGPYILVANPGRVAGIALYRQANPSDNFMVLGSNAVGNDIIAIAARGIVAALDADPAVETATSGTLVMQDSNPAVAGTTGPEKEMFQTDCIALKVRWPVSWALRNSAAVAWLTPTWK